MSVTTVEAASIAAPGVGAQAAIARIAELQTLLARAHGAEPAAAAAAPTTSFAQALAGQGAGQSLAGVAATGGAFAPLAGGALPADVTASAGGLGGAPSPFDSLIAAAAQRHGIDPALLKGLIRAESNFDPTVTSSAGAGGLVQLMPGTAASLGVTDRFDPAQSIDGGARYLRQQLDAFGGDVTKALAAYNAGPGAVQRYNGVPPYAETQAYVQKVQAYAAEYRQPAPVAAVAPPPPGAFGGGFAPVASTLPTSTVPTTGSGSIT